MRCRRIIERDYDSGRITYDNSRIVWEKPDCTPIIVDLEEVVVIGEYTTDSGPFADDWFLVFVFYSGDWKEVSVYADGYQELENMIANSFEIEFSKPFLANSSEWRSFGRYPKCLEGKELFHFIQPQGYKAPTSIIDYLKLALGLGSYGKAWEFDLTEEVKAELDKANMKYFT